MKKICYLGLFMVTFQCLLGQNIQKQTNEGVLLVPDSLRNIIPIKKQALLSNVDVIFNTRFGFDSFFSDGKHTQSNFKGNQFRLEIKGKVHEKVYFRFRHRYTREPDVGNLDNIDRTVDLAMLRFDVTPRTSLSIGKMFGDWGGYEFDFNPIDIMAYNDIIENADNFLVGVGLAHELENKKHSFSFQVLNSRTKTFQEQYGAFIPENLKASKFPLAFVTNWRGLFFNGKWATTYSYSYYNEAAATAHMHYVVLGNKLQLDKFLLYYDFHYSREGLDRKGIISTIINPVFQVAAQDVRYIEHWVRAEYLIAPKVNLILTLMNSNHRWNDNPDPGANTLLSRSYGVIPTIEYLPFKDINLRFFVGYVGRKFNFTNYAENAFGAKDYTTGQLSFGIVAPLNVM